MIKIYLSNYLLIQAEINKQVKNVNILKLYLHMI